MSWRRESRYRTVRGLHRGIDDPTVENAADQVPERSRVKDDEDLVRRTAWAYDYTPRRYDQPLEADDAVAPPDVRSTRRPHRQKR